MLAYISLAFGRAHTDNCRALLQLHLLLGENGVASLIHDLDDMTEIAQGFDREPIHQLVSPIQRNVADNEGYERAQKNQLQRGWTAWVRSDRPPIR